MTEEKTVCEKNNEEKLSLKDSIIVSKVMDEVIPHMETLNNHTKRKVEELGKSNLSDIYKIINENNSRNAIMRRFIDCCDRNIPILKKTESTSGGKEAEVAALCIMSGASMVIKSNKIEYSRNKFNYANLEDLYSAIKESEDRFNKDVCKNGMQARITNNVLLNILNERDCVATIDQKCIVYNEKGLEHISTYTCSVEILMANMIMEETELSKGASLMQDKGKWISYIRRYALAQFLNISCAEDIEKYKERMAKEEEERIINANKNPESLAISIDEAR